MFSQNLEKYRKKAGFTFESLANSINNILGTKFNKSTARTWENGATPKIDTIEAISEVLNVPIQYLFDDGIDAIDGIIKDKIPTFKNMVENTKKVILLDGYLGAGSGGIIENVKTIDYLYVDNSMIKKQYRNEEIKALTVIGDSMSPYVNGDDIVLFTSLKDRNLADGKYIITTMNGTMIKNLSFKANGDIVISSENKAYNDELIKADESQEILDIVGIVVGRILKN